MWWLVAYAVIGVILLVPFNRFVHEEIFEGDDDSDFRVMEWVLAVLFGAMWPFIVVGLLAIAASKFAWSFFDKPKVNR